MELYSIIKNYGPGNVLLWKFSGEDFNDNSQLIVNDAEEAIFIYDGKILEIFKGGKYTLNSDNYPFINGLRRMITGGVNPFSCKVYFISKAHKLEILWGTDSPIQIRDAEFKFMVGIRARGSYSLKIDDSKNFYLKLVGNNISSYAVEDVQKSFKSLFIMNIKNKLANLMSDMKMTVLDMSSQLEKTSSQMKPLLQPIFDEYGLKIINFYIVDISIPEDDPNYQRISEAYSKKASVKIQGEDWSRIQTSEILKDAVNNPNGGMATLGAQLGAGLAVGTVAGSGMGHGVITPLTSISALSPQNESSLSENKCLNCGLNNESNAKFCQECGNPIPVKKQYCANCGAELKPNAKFCIDCGTKRV
jgi:membrane protease subunit (stomatin/prohibitin family)